MSQKQPHPIGRHDGDAQRTGECKDLTEPLEFYEHANRNLSQLIRVVERPAHLSRTFLVIP